MLAFEESAPEMFGFRLLVLILGVHTLGKTRIFWMVLQLNDE